MPSTKGDYLLLVLVVLIAYWFGRRQSHPSTTAGSSTSGFRTDVATNIAFPTTQKFQVSGSKLSLVGVGTRKKAIINVYSVGVFVSNSIQKKIADLEGRAICEALLSMTSPKAVQLTFAMGIGPGKIAETVSQISGVEESVRILFHDMLMDGMGGKMKKGETMTFEWNGKDVIHATARGKYIGSVKDRALASGVLKLYVGPKSVSPTLLHDIGC